jgi:hypothetical protein
MHRNRVQRIFFKNFLKGYMRLSLILIGVFGVIGLFHPGFFIYGARHLSQVLASDLAVSAFVLPPPVTPVMSSDLTCNPLNLSFAFKLDWQIDSGGGTFSYDLYRNGLPMVVGLPSDTVTYTDTALTIATVYTYTLRANGPMGPGYEDSLPITLTTPYNCDGLSQPTVSVTKFQNRLVSTYDGIAYTHTRRPKVIGTSNIPYARIRVVINSETRMVSETTANINGYWEWTPPVRLNFERSVMNFTATDPLNSNRYVGTSLRYQIIRSEQSEDSEKKKDKRDSGVPGGNSSNDQSGNNIPNDNGIEFDFTSSQSEVRQGENITFTLTPKKLTTGSREQNTKIEYRLLDEEGNSMATLSKEAFLRVDVPLSTELKAPVYLRPGQYTVEAVIMIDGVLYSQALPITIKSLPVIALSSGREITYDEFMWNLGWMTLIALATLLLWLFFVFHEYWLYLQGQKHTDEYKIGRLGYFSRL